MDAYPLDGYSIGPALADEFELVAFPAHQVVAIHADLGWGNTGNGGGFNSGVAIAAVDSQLAGVQPVTVGHRLVGTVADIRKAG